jgi:hypothetical protein
MLRLVGFFVVYFVLVGVANAELLSSTGEDPMTDEKWAVASADFEGPQAPHIFFKCWSKGALSWRLLRGLTMTLPLTRTLSR